MNRVLLTLVLPPSTISPFDVAVGQEAGPQQIRAWGPGLEGGIVGKPATFVVESIGPDAGVLGESLGGILKFSSWMSVRQQRT